MSKRKRQPDYMSDQEISDYYNMFDWQSMTATDAKRIMESRAPHPNASRQRSRLLYDWLMRKLSGLPMWDKG